MERWRELGADFLRLLPLDGRRVLDVGCGNGWAAILMKEAGADVTAMDILDASDPRFEELHKRGIPLKHSLDGLEGFDAVWCHHMMEHSCAPIAFLHQLRSIAKELWVTVPKERPDRYAKDHIMPYNLPVLIEHLRRSGWDVVNGSFRTHPGPTRGVIQAVVKRFPAFAGCDHGKEIGDYCRECDFGRVWSKYPPPMGNLNREGDNHLKSPFYEWNWSTVGGDRT